MFHPDQERREQFQNVTLPDNICCSDLNFSLRCYLDYTPTYYYNVYATVVVPFPFSFSVSFPYTNHFFNHICFLPHLGSAWECHPGCKRFCLSSCKRSCCAPGAPNYSPAMFPQLVNYQASLPPPPPPPPACPAGCPSTCYPNCDSGCCFQANQPVFPQYANPYDVGYTGYPAGDPCAAMSCSAACAPQCKPG